MGSNKKPTGHIHKIREFELEKINLADEFDILQIVGEGWFGKILLVEHRGTDTEMVLKALPKPYVSLRDFYREFHYGLHLGVHKNIVTTYDVAFETAGFYVFTQEYAPLGDLTSNVMDTGIGELHTKRVAKQIAAALEFMHSKDLVHRDVKLDNVLVCRSDFARVKLCDFGESRRSGSLVQRRNEWLPYSPPEVLTVKTDDTYKTLPCHDVWQFGIVIFICLTGCLPWQKAATDDPRYVRFLNWHGSSMINPIKRTPKLFKLVSSNACKMFKKFLEPNEDRRPKSLGDLTKYLDDRWLTKSAEKELVATEPDELCPSMYSFHSSPEEKNKLLSTLAQHGIETVVDRVSKKNRIRDWIQSSVITEEDEDDDSGTATPSSTMSRTPIAGHISSIRAMEEKETQEKQITTTIKDAANKHIDPRTGRVQKGPSEMGGVFGRKENNFIENNNTRNLSLIDVNYKSSSDSNYFSPGQSIVNGSLNVSITNGSQDQNSTIFSSDRSLLSSYQSIKTITPPEYESRSIRNLHHDPIRYSVMDSGYGSLDKLRTNEAKKANVSSPLLKRSLTQRTTNTNYLTTNSLITKDPSPFDSDDDSPHGSNGFVNLVGDRNGSKMSMKDTAYDRIKSTEKCYK